MTSTLTQTAVQAVQKIISGRLQVLSFAERLRSAIKHNFQSAYVTDSITELPRRRHTATLVAAILFPEFTQTKADMHYENTLSRAQRVVRQRKELDLMRHQAYANDAIAAEFQGEWRGQEYDPVSLEGPIAMPMPVEIGTNEDFKDVFQFLHLNLDPRDVLSPEKKDMREELTSALGLQAGKEIKWETPMVEFKRGVVYEDGRLDLCKMVVGPTHIEKLLDALEENTVVTQFLLGNNVISTTGARRIAKFIADHPERIETWYLAGNHIRAPGFQLLVDAMVNSPRITNVWLKRNPLTPDSIDNVVRLITQTSNLRTLDLDNTELGNEGVARIMTELTGRDVPLRHLYLNANGIGEKAAIAIAGYLAHPVCKLESLYLASNPIGDAGALPIAEALKSNTSLLRLSVGSTGLTSRGIVALSRVLAVHQRIMSLDLAASQTTRVHAQRFNHLANGTIPALTALMQNPTMRHLDLGRTALSAGGLEDLKAAVPETNLCEFRAFRKPDFGEATSCPLATRRALEGNVKRFYPDEEGYRAFTNGLNARFLYSPEDVRLIDSVYRTRDQRSDKEIQQFWEDGDPVWEMVDADV